MLKELVANGLGLNSRCRSRKSSFLDQLFNPSPIFGALPSCIWSLPQLEIIELAGNMLSGYLPTRSIELGKNLSRVILNNNKISGTIRSDLMSPVNAVEIDVSANRVTGTLEGFFNFTEEHLNRLVFKSYINRLSGTLPLQELNALKYLDVLRGNLFSCGSMTKTLLPRRDPDSSEYSCGSDSLDFTMILWSTVCIICSAATALVYFHNSKFIKDVYFDLLKYPGVQLTSLDIISNYYPETFSFLNVLREVAILGSKCAVFIIVTTIVAYPSFKVDSRYVCVLGLTLDP